MAVVAIISLAVVMGAATQGSIGFGYALVAVPAMALLLPWAVPTTPRLLALPMTVLMSAREWRSFEDLERFARNPDDPHLPAWQRFNRTVGSDGSVGIFYETYIVERGNYEAIYSNMPVSGLAKATEHVRAVRGRETAASDARRERTGRPFA